MKQLRAFFDPFLVLLILTVILASLLPARGAAVPIAEGATDIAIVLLFFLHGAKLSRAAILSGAKAWQLHLATLGTTFLLFPLIGLALQGLGGISAELRAGLLFLTLLPSTVQSSIAFTAIARGHVAAAVVSASFSNLAGMVLTPLLAALLMHGASADGGSLVSLSSIKGILLQLMLPFVAGHLLRPVIGGFVDRNKSWLGKVDRTSILLVVYTAFSAAVVEGLWQSVSRMELALLIGLSIFILIAVLGFTWALGRLLSLPRGDAIVLQFCGSKKSLATGVPIAGLLFPAAMVGPILLPVMIFHQIQLMACALLARHYGAQAEVEESA